MDQGRETTAATNEWRRKDEELETLGGAGRGGDGLDRIGVEFVNLWCGQAGTRE